MRNNDNSRNNKQPKPLLTVCDGCGYFQKDITQPYWLWDRWNVFFSACMFIWSMVSKLLCNDG